MKPKIVQYIAREAVRRYGDIEPRLSEKLQRNIRRNFAVTVPRVDVRIPEFIEALSKRFPREPRTVIDLVAWYTVHYEYLR